MQGRKVFRLLLGKKSGGENLGDPSNLENRGGLGGHGHGLIGRGRNGLGGKRKRERRYPSCELGKGSDEVNGSEIFRGGGESGEEVSEIESLSVLGVHEIEAVRAVAIERSVTIR